MAWGKNPDSRRMFFATLRQSRTTAGTPPSAPHARPRHAGAIRQRKRLHNPVLRCQWRAVNSTMSGPAKAEAQGAACRTAVVGTGACSVLRPWVRSGGLKTRFAVVRPAPSNVRRRCLRQGPPERCAATKQPSSRGFGAGDLVTRGGGSTPKPWRSTDSRQPRPSGACERRTACGWRDASRGGVARYRPPSAPFAS